MFSLGKQFGDILSAAVEVMLKHAAGWTSSAVSFSQSYMLATACPSQHHPLVFIVVPLLALAAEVWTPARL